MIHVPGDQPTIQAGIDAAAAGDTVLVADGTYTGEGNRDLDLGGKAITVRSENGPESCVIDCQGSDTESHKGFYLHQGEGSLSVIQGFTIRHGVAAGGSTIPEIYGGAILCDGASPAILENVLQDNRARWYGGGLACRNSQAVIDSNRIEGNSIEDGYGAGVFAISSSLVLTGNAIHGNIGEGLAFRWGSPVTLMGNTITDNQGDGLLVRTGTSTPFVSLVDNTIAGNAGNGVYCAGASISGNRIRANEGCGIRSHSDGVRISGNVISDNGSWSLYGGGGIRSTGASVEISENWITGNRARFGGGIMTEYQAAVIINNLIAGNSARSGGGIWIYGSDPLHQMANNTLAGNIATQEGGALDAYNGVLQVADCTLWGDSAPNGAEISVGSSTLNISYSDVEGGLAACSVDSGSQLVWGLGMIDANPRFAAGPLGGYYLGQTAAGQAFDSPCLDTGSDLAANICYPWEEGTICLDELTTRTDLLPDSGQVDMGYHYPLESGPGTSLLVVGPGAGPNNLPLVRVFPPEEGATPAYEFSAYSTPGYGVRVGAGDVDGDGLDEILTAPGPGEMFGPHVRGFAVDGSPLSGLSFLAYGTNRFGVNVATGDLDGDGFHEIVTGAGPGQVFGPHVRAFDYDGGPEVEPMPGVSFIAYGTHQWGVNVAAGDIDGDGFAEIVTGAGPGAVFGPHVRGWDVDGGAAAAIPAVSFLAYGTHRFGVNVACGDVDGDGLAEIVTAPGPSVQFGAHVRGWNFDGAAVAPLPGLSFFAWALGQSHFGAQVSAGADLDGDGLAEIVVGAGPDPLVLTPVRAYGYVGDEVILRFSLEAFPGGVTHGTTVAGGEF